MHTLPRRSLWIANHEWVCHLCRYRAAKAARNVTFCWKSWQKTFKIHFVILGTENPLPSLFRTSSKKKIHSIHPFYTGHVITKTNTIFWTSFNVTKMWNYFFPPKISFSFDLYVVDFVLIALCEEMESNQLVVFFPEFLVLFLMVIYPGPGKSKCPRE